MGNYFSPNIEESLKRNQDVISEMNAIKLERQMQMLNQMRERIAALDLARRREMFYWYGAFYITSIAWAMAGYKAKRHSVILAPFIPLSFFLAYQYDLSYGNKMHRIKVEADHIMQFEKDLLALPLGLPTAASLDLGRLQNDEAKKLHPILPAI